MLTKKEAIQEFREEVLPIVLKEFGKDDKPALAEAWNNWTDALRKGGRITAKQYGTWVHPF